MKIFSPSKVLNSINRGGFEDHRTPAQKLLERVNDVFKEMTTAKPGIPNTNLEKLKNGGVANYQTDDDFYLSISAEDSRGITCKLSYEIRYFCDREEFAAIIKDAVIDCGWNVVSCSVGQFGLNIVFTSIPNN